MSADLKDKASRLIWYLKDLPQIRALIVREIVNYPHVLWFKGVPREPEECYLKIKKTTEFKSNYPALKQNMPQAIQEALSLKLARIRNYIVEILKDRPNNSCVRKKLGKYLLRHFELRTWGQHREAFCRKVDSSVSYMSMQEQVKVYKTSKNIRVKLL